MKEQIIYDLGAWRVVDGDNVVVQTFDGSGWKSVCVFDRDERAYTRAREVAQRFARSPIVDV